MQDLTTPKLAKWPFLLGDAFLLGLAYYIMFLGNRPLELWQVLACTLAVMAGAGCGIWPFLLEYRVVARLAETERLRDAVSQIQRMDQLADQIRDATGLWQSVQESADRTAGAAREIVERMASEVKGFNEFFQRMNEGEKATLRLEVEKLRRAEADWLQVLVHTLDHVYALHQAALRSGQPSLIEQLGQFQNACRDAARRVGLAPFVPSPEERFDAERHQLAEGETKPSGEAAIESTMATGYTFQGRLLRPALVRLRNGNGTEPAPDESETGSAESQSEQNQFPFDANAGD